jgi:hypothetical protein
MRRFNQSDAKKIWNELSINWNEVSLEKFMRGLDIEAELAGKDTKTRILANEGKWTDETSWAHLEELRDYYSRLDKME